MKHRCTKKITHILDAVVTYLLEQKAKRITNELVEEDSRYRLKIEAEIELQETEFLSLKNQFEACHQLEYDEYWTLVGESFHGDDMSLVLSLVDQAALTYEQGLLKIYLEREK